MPELLPGGRSQRPADFVILSTMRSGSGNLQDALSEHPEIECGAEVFNPSHVQIWGRLFMEERARPWARLAGSSALMAITRAAKRRCPGFMLRMARRPQGKRLFGFRLFGDHVSYFALDPFLDDLHAHGVRFVHLVRRDTFDQAVSLVRAQITGIWKVRRDTPTPATRLDFLTLADRVTAAAELLQGHKLIAATVARRYGAMLLDYDEYTRDERSYDRIQELLEVRSRVVIKHANLKSAPIDPDVCRMLREEVQRRRAPMMFDPEAV